jgi:hypothetical protein
MTHVQLGFTIQDENGDKSRLTFNTDTDMSIAQLLVVASDLQDLVKAVIMGGIVDASFCIVVPINAGNEVVADTARVNQGAKFIWQTAGGFFTSFRLPTRMEAIIADGSKDVDRDQVNVAPLIAAIEGGFTSGTETLVFTDYRLDPVAALSSAKEHHTSQRQ